MTRYLPLAEWVDVGSGIRTALAADTRLGRTVEVATVPVAEGQGAVLARLTSLRHPAVAPVVDVEIDDDRVLLAWPAAIGRPLPSGLAPRTLLDALGPVADALDEAHRLGLAHGALEPAAVEVQPAARAVPARVRLLGVRALAGAGTTPADDRRCLASIARHALLGSGRAVGRIERLGPVIEAAGPPPVPAAVADLLDAAIARPGAHPSCTALVIALRALVL